MTEVKDLHSLKARIPIDVTEDGMSIDERLVQEEKADSPIEERLDLIFTVFKLLHRWNEKLPIEVTPEGIVMDCNELHP